MAMRLAIGIVMILGAAACGSSEPPVGEGTASPDAVADMADVDPTAIRPFEIDVPDEVLLTLPHGSTERGSRTRWGPTGRMAPTGRTCRSC